MRLDPFVFDPWRELKRGDQEKRDRKKKKAEAKKNRLDDLRSQLKEKERRLRELKETRELAPGKEFMQTMKDAHKKKSKSLELMSGYDNAQREAEDRLGVIAKELVQLRKKRKSQRELVKYYKLQLEKTEAVTPKMASAQRRKDAALELFEHERDQLQIAKRDTKLLIQENEQLENELDEHREFAHFDAMEVRSSAVQIQPDRAKNIAPMSTKYRQDMLQVVMELIDSGVETDSIQTIFESVFQCVNFPVKRFPNSNIIRRIRSDQAKISSAHE